MNDLNNKYNAKLKHYRDMQFLFSNVLKALLISFLTFMATQVFVLCYQDKTTDEMLYSVLIALAVWACVFVVYIFVKIAYDEYSKYQLDTLLEQIGRQRK